MPSLAAIEAYVDNTITKYRTTDILYYPYSSGATDLYKQRTKSFGTAVTLIGRAIIRPTSEVLTVIGNGEVYDIAFLFSRSEMVRKFPTASEGEWMNVDGEIAWFNRRYKIERVTPTGQVSTTFLLVAVLAMSIPGARD